MKHSKHRRRHLHAATLATLAVCTTGSGMAQGPSADESPVTQSASDRTPIAFSISAGPLKEALHAFEVTTGINLRIDIAQPTIGSIDPLDGMRTPGVDGQFTPELALRKLLQGTGLTFKFADLTNARVGIETQETIDVVSSLPSAVAMTKFTEPLLDTPQTIVSVPDFILKEQGVSTLRDTLRNVPGISLAAGEFGAQGDNLTIRGFTARNDIFLDGIRDFGSYYRDAFDYEQVDVLEGPAGVQFGRGATGGVINQESKVPEEQKLLNVQTQFGTNLMRRLSVDYNRPLPQIPGGSAFRLNGMGVESNFAGRDKAEIRRYGIAPSLAFGMNTRTHATFNYVHLVEDDTPDYGLPYFFNRLAPGVAHSSYFGFGSKANGSRNYLKTGDDIVTAKVAHDFGHGFDLHSIARWASYRRNAQITEPQICSNASLAVPVGGFVAALPTSSVTGLTCTYSPDIDPSTILVNRNQLQVKSVEGNLWDQTEVTTRFKIHGIGNSLAAGVEGGQEISNPVRTSYTFNKLNAITPATLINPNEDDVFNSTGYISSITHAKSKSVGLYFVDTVKLGRLFELSGGVRWDRFDTGFNLYAPAVPAGGAASATIAPISQVVAKPTYRAAFVYKPSVHGSVYFDYGTSFNPSAETLALSVSNSVLPPEENETYEGGAKWSFLNERLMVEGAIFRTTKDNARETDPTNSNNIVLAGNQLVKGTTLSLVGRLPHGMDVVMGYAYLASDVQSSKFFPTSVGYQLANVPKQTFNLFVTHRLPMHFNGGFGSNYIASRTASSTVPFMPLTFSGPQTFAAGTAPCGTAASTTCYQVLTTGTKQVPGYWLFSAMLNHPVTDRVNFQVNVNNLANKFFIDQPHPSHLVPGEGLNALIGVNFRL